MAGSTMTFPDGWHAAAKNTPFARALADAGLGLVEEEIAADRLLVEMAAAKLGCPLWIRSSGRDDPRFCARLDSEDDLMLAYLQAAKRSAERKVLVQRAVDGPAWRLWCHTRDATRPVLTLEAGFISAPPYRLLDYFALPPEAPARVTVMAEALRAAPPLAARWLEAEVVLSEDGALLTGLWQSEDLHPAVEALMRPTSHGAEGWRAVAWLSSRSGQVTSIGGEDAARALPGVLALHVGVRPGDVLKHAVDEASVHRTGYAVAQGESRALAIARAQEAARMVQIHASAVLG
jgi:hypothetical protein